MSLDASLMDVSIGKRADKDYAIAWCRDYGKGRVFYTALGHMKELWTDETFMKKHILPAIRWAMGDEKWKMPAKK
jgi:type 1 glutamine amidotransferase